MLPDAFTYRERGVRQETPQKLLNRPASLVYILVNRETLAQTRKNQYSVLSSDSYTQVWHALTHKHTSMCTPPTHTQEKGERRKVF